MGKKESPPTVDADLLAYWNEQIGLPEEPEDENSGTRVKLGNGLGVKSDAEEELEDKNVDSSMCPIILGHDMDDKINRPNSRPTEAAAIDED